MDLKIGGFMKLSIHSFTAILVATLFLPNNGSAQSKTEDTVSTSLKKSLTKLTEQFQ